MKKFICLVLVIVMLLLFLTSCVFDALLKVDSPFLLLTACVRYSVPGFYQSDLKGADTETDVVEVDDYGRTLICYTGYNFLTDKNECVYVICQKHSNSIVYFYENVNYTWAGESTTDLENFKKKNDWNCAINESKLSSRKVYVSFDLCLVKNSPFSKISDEDFYLSLSENCGIAQDMIYSVKYCDWDGQNRVLYLIRLENGEQLFCVVDTEYNTFTVEIENSNDFYAELYDLKHKSGWHYG